MSRTRFLVLYLLAMLPTYVLPWFGSNSLLAQTVYAGSGTGAGLMLGFIHGLFLAALVYLASARGRTNGRGAMVALAIVAAIFDMAPLLSAIPLVPTVLHVITLVLGSMGRDAAPNGPAAA